MELTDQEQQIVDAMKDLGATAEDRMKTADDISRKVGISKSFVANILINMANKKIVKRVVRQKAAGYYLLQVQ